MPSLQSAFLKSVTIAAPGLLLAFVCGCAAPASPVVLRPSAQMGDSIDLEMQVSRVEKFTRDPKVTKNPAIPVQIRVIDAGKETVVEWKAGAPHINEAAGKPVFNPASTILENQSVEVVLDESSQPTSVRNLDELMKSTATAIDQLEKSLPKDKANEAIISHFRKSFGNPVTAERLALYRSGRYFLPYGRRLVPGEPITQQKDVPTNYSAQPLPMAITIELKRFKPTDTHYVVTYEQVVDQERLPVGMRSNGQRPGIGVLLPGSPRFNMIEHGEFRINRATGWVEHAKVEHTVISNESTHSELIEFSLPK
jgi:hypothetical protein